MSLETATPSIKEMVLIPGGPFIMGSEEFGPETPQHTVDIPPFYIDKYPVTNAEYALFVEATGRPAPPAWTGGTYPADRGDHTVITVNWYEASAYAAWMGKRLPTEAEWEKAARGTDGRRYPWGDRFEERRTVVWESAMIRDVTTVPVTAYPTGASPHGVCQMAGHVEEWVEDWYEPYAGSRYQSRCYGRKLKVLKGGSWFYTQQYARGAFRRPLAPDSRGWDPFDGPGFRCARDG
jgi:eukaryotic-like serine/threonine-protein kinase